MAKIYNYFSEYINDDDLAYIGSGKGKPQNANIYFQFLSRFKKLFI